MATNQDFTITKDGYIAFDALSLKDQLNKRLGNSGIFTDQNFEGSNISAYTDLIAFTFHVLMFYLNRTSSESMFSTSQIYENMNRIVKTLDYKPVGFQTSTLSFNASAANLNPDLYTIPRYSYINVNNIPFSFNEDITFTKTTTVLEELTELSKQKLLYQGRFIEYPIYDANGIEDELIYLIVNTDEIVDHFNIDIYVKSQNGNWQQFDRTPSLYLENAFATKYEIRFNENKRYEIKFGNNINGRKLEVGDRVAIYYLQSLGSAGEVGAGALNNKNVYRFDSVQFKDILNDVIANQYNFLTGPQLQNLAFSNNSISTYVNPSETVDQIRKNAPGTFRSQYRLVTENDYENFIQTNFGNLIHDVKVVSNMTYLTENLKYYFDLGITKPNRESRVLFNQVNFSDACNFNNIYITVVPRVMSSTAQFNNYLTPAQKELITTSMEAEKTLTTEVVLVDPVYIAVDIAISDNPTNPTSLDANNTNLLIVKDSVSRRDDSSIKLEVQKIFLDYFDKSNTSLGQTININTLVTSLLSINGVKTIFTARTDGSVKYEGLSLLLWNPIYKDIDINLTFKNLVLPYFKYPYFNNLDTFIDKIKVVSEHSFENVDY